MADRLNTDLLTPQRLRAVAVTAALAAAGYIAVSLWFGADAVLAALSAIGPGGLLIALLLSLFNYALRFARWHGFLARLGHRPPLVASGGIYLAGFALTTVPGKIGEAVRSLFLKPFGIPFPHSLAAFAAERMADLAAMLLLCALGASAYPPARPFMFAAVALLLGLLLSLHAADMIERLGRRIARWSPARLDRPLVGLVQTLHQARSLFAPLPLLAGLMAGWLAWAAEGYALYLVVQWLGVPISLPVALFIYAFAMVVGALSFLPGGLGGAEVAMVALLVINGLPEPAAVAATVLIRLATLWFAVALGLLALLFGRLAPILESTDHVQPS